MDVLRLNLGVGWLLIVLFPWICNGSAQQTSSSAKVVEEKLYHLVNEHRKAKKLLPLILNKTIVKQAQQHSKNMADGKLPFSHKGFDERMEMIAKDISYHGAAENIAVYPDSVRVAESVFQQWLKSRSHQENIEGDYDLTGIGAVQDTNGKWFFTQIFVLHK